MFLRMKDILIGSNRQRKEFDDEALGQLAESISRLGLLQPIVVRHAMNGVYTLVAGERRLRAIGQLEFLADDVWTEGLFMHGKEPVPRGHVPVVLLDDCDAITAHELELEENIRRMDLTWQERAEALASLHKLRESQAIAAGKPTHTYQDTAIETLGRSDGDYAAKTRKAIIVAGHMDNPNIAKATSVDEAFKILKREEQRTANVQLAATIGQTFSSADHELHHTDCIVWMAAAEPAQFDVICTDPPYGIDADSFGHSGGTRLVGGHEYDDSPEAFQSLMSEWMPLSARVAKASAHMYLFCDIGWFQWLKERAADAGWTPFRTPLIWVKGINGRVPLPEHGPRRQYETILYCFRGGRPVTAIYPDVLEFAQDANLGHGAQKPVELIRNLLLRSVRPGDRVLDSFCGSGSIFPAAHSLLCRGVGLEQSPASYGLASQRLEGLA